MKISLARSAAIAALISFAVMPALLSAGQNTPQHSHHEKQGTRDTNPLMEEMIILDGVFREVVSAVSLGDGQRVHAALESMHGTMEKTHEGVHSGTVKIPRNSDRVDEFVQMDKEFHGNLEALAHAAHTNNQKDMLSLTKTLLDGCVNCHRIFRK
jgi:cytochrome c556